MLFWIVAIAISAGGIGLGLLPMLRGVGGRAVTAPDVEIYKDQIRALDDEVGRGVLTEDEAAASRAEIGRRLLAADAAAQAETAPAPRNASLGAGLVALLVSMGGGYVLYDRVGAPGMPDAPLASRDFRAERMSQAEAEAEAADQVAAGVLEPSPRDAALLERLREVLAERKDDPVGHRLLASTLASLGRFAEARDAQLVAIEAAGAEATAEDYATLAEMLIFAAQGYVSPEAEDALTAALERDARDVRARYYTGIALAQAGQPEMAMALWSGLLEEAPPDAPWTTAVVEQMQAVAEQAGLPMPGRPADGGLRGPTAEDIEAAGAMDAEDRMAMVRGMVEGLEDRLATEGGSAEEWARLVRSLAILGEGERARTIFDEARATFAEDAESLSLIEAAGAEAGLAAE